MIVLVFRLLVVPLIFFLNTASVGSWEEMGVSIVSQLRSVSHIRLLLSKYQFMKLKCCCVPDFRASIKVLVTFTVSIL